MSASGLALNASTRLWACFAQHQVAALQGGEPVPRDAPHGWLERGKRTRQGPRSERRVILFNQPGREKRPQFDALHKAATRREFDVVMAWSVDRLGRSLQDLVGFLSELHAVGIDLFLHQQGVSSECLPARAIRVA
jgi:Resolvase, N terminal domain